MSTRLASGYHWMSWAARARPRLNKAAFEALLSALDPDRERAGEEYESIRRQLVKFFECRACADPEHRADETIDRVSRKVAEGEQIRASDPALYLYGVARNVLRESWRSARRERRADDPSRVAGQASDPLAPVEDLAQRRLACLDRCLEGLSADDRNLILWYYQQGERVMVQARKDLAGRLGIPLNALRIRAHRIRGRLEACVLECLGRSSNEMDSPREPLEKRDCES